MATALPLLPTTMVGSYAMPAWLHCADEAVTRGEFGPTDVEETFDDAIMMALRDQEEAGIDIVTDGEMRRRGFIQSLFRRISNLKDLGAPRQVGETGLDLEPNFQALGKVELPAGLGVVEEFKFLKSKTARPVKVTIPSPLALTPWILPGGSYKSRQEISWDLVSPIREEIRALAAAGADFIQIDTPNQPASDGTYVTPREMVDVYNACVEGITGVRFALHLCFGTYKKMPYSKRSYGPFFPTLLEAKAEQFVLEFANREMSEIEKFKDWLGGRELGAGVIDIRNYYIETPEDVAAMIRRCLEVVPAEKLYLNPDCGMRRVARWIARRKLHSLVQGAAIVRRELAGN